VDRRNKCCKRHVLTDVNGIPLVVQTRPANPRDDGKVEDLLEGFPVLTDGVTGVVHVLPTRLGTPPRGHGAGKRTKVQEGRKGVGEAKR
jgi:hypothetical protein